MDVKKLKDLIENIPDNAKVYVESDHGQTSEIAGAVCVTYDDSDLPFYGDELEWENTGDMSAPLNVTAVRIN